MLGRSGERAAARVELARAQIRVAFVDYDGDAIADEIQAKTLASMEAAEGAAEIARAVTETVSMLRSIGLPADDDEFALFHDHVMRGMSEAHSKFAEWVKKMFSGRRSHLVGDDVRASLSANQQWLTAQDERRALLAAELGRDFASHVEEDAALAAMLASLDGDGLRGAE